MLKVAPVVDREDTHDAGWLGGIFDGEGHLTQATGWHLGMTQNQGAILDRAQRLLAERGFACSVSGKQGEPRFLRINGGRYESLRFLMLARPERLIENLRSKVSKGGVSLYGRDHRVVKLLAKEQLGVKDVVSIETDTHTFVAEGLASHNCNFWRALQAEPDGVAAYADWPVNENDLHARHAWLTARRAELSARLEGDPDYYDARIAGWWVWGMACWIGSSFCSGEGPWSSVDGRLVRDGETGAIHRKLPHLGAGRGVNRQLPHLGAGRGVNRQLPHLGAGRGVNRQLPHLGDAGKGIIANRGDGLPGYMRGLADRLRRVRVCCGDWERICGPTPTCKQGLTGIFLDPPYSAEAGRDEAIYSEEDLECAHRVREWAIANGQNPLMRIALCGYEGEHQMPPDWDCVPWKAQGGYGGQGNGAGRENAHRERIWFNRSCLGARQPSLF